MAGGGGPVLKRGGAPRLNVCAENYYPFIKRISEAILGKFSKPFCYGYCLASGDNHHGQVPFSYMFSAQTNPSSNPHYSFNQPPPVQVCCRYNQQRPSFGPGHFKLSLALTVCTCFLLLFFHTQILNAVNLLPQIPRIFPILFLSFPHPL